MSDDKAEGARNEVKRLVSAGVIREVKYPEWLANTVMVKKANGKWRMVMRPAMEKSGGRLLCERRHFSSTILKTASKSGMWNFDGSMLHLIDISTSPIVDEATRVCKQGASCAFPAADPVPALCIIVAWSNPFSRL